MNIICMAAFGKQYSFKDPKFQENSHVTAMEHDLPDLLPIMALENTPRWKTLLIMNAIHFIVN